jgi:hypothetical protein
MSLVVYFVGLVVIAAVAIAVAAPLLWPHAAAGPLQSTTDPELYRLEKEKELAYAAIKEADFDLQMGKLSPEDHAGLRAKYEAKAMAALQALDGRADALRDDRAGSSRDRRA